MPELTNAPLREAKTLGELVSPGGDALVEDELIVPGGGVLVSSLRGTLGPGPGTTGPTGRHVILHDRFGGSQGFFLGAYFKKSTATTWASRGTLTWHISPGPTITPSNVYSGRILLSGLNFGFPSVTTLDTTTVFSTGAGGMLDEGNYLIVEQQNHQKLNGQMHTAFAYYCSLDEENITFELVASANGTAIDLEFVWARYILPGDLNSELISRNAGQAHWYIEKDPVTGLWSDRKLVS